MLSSLHQESCNCWNICHYLASPNITCNKVYFQIVVWMGMEKEMNPTEWGWKQEIKQLIPIMTQNNDAWQTLENYLL